MSEEVKWTGAQSAAIEAAPCTLLVSAAAGSGKTAVLTERLAGRIADPNDELTIENAVVVTFNKSAANELRERIGAKLAEQLSKKPDKRLFSQLAALPTARISTVHSFCYSLIKEHAHTLGLSPTVKVADDMQSGQLKKEAAAAVIRGYFEDEPGFCVHDKGDFLLLCQTLGVKIGDKTLSDFITKLHGDLCSYPEPMKLIPRSAKAIRRDLDRLASGEITLGEAGVVKELIRILKKPLADAEKKLETCRELCLGEDELVKKCLPIIENDLSFVKTLIGCSEKNVIDASGQAEFKRYPTLKNSDPEKGSRIHKLRDSAKQTILAFCDSLPRDSAAALKNLRTSAALEEAAAALVTDFDREYRRLKEQSGCIDYSDLEQFALSLLCENVEFDGVNARFDPTPAARLISQSVCELYVDEYQDTNTVQDMIFRAVSLNGKMFIVGDPKQSIYAFRGAVPAIFTGYKNSFTSEGKDGKRKIVLSENFRCDSSVVALTNAIFSVAMNSDPDESLYLPEDMLIKAKNSESSLKAELVLIDGSGASDGSDAEDGALPADSARAQGICAAKKIIEIVNSHVKTDKGQPIGFGDVAVLSRNKEDLASVKKALRAAGIPCSADADDSFFKSAEILFITSLLELTDDPNNDASLAAVLNSPVFGFTPDLLLEIRRALPDGSFCAAAKAFSENGTEAADKLKAVYALTNELREFSRTSSVCGLVKKALEKTDALNVYSAAGGYLNRERNVKFLLDKASECDRRRDADVRALLDGLAALKIQENDSQGAAGCVRFMTFHRSKGLEFPVVIAVGLEGGYNFSDQRETWCADPEFGVGFRQYDDEFVFKEPSQLYRLISSKSEKELKEEEKRLLYVAMTRARQKLILIGSVKLAVNSKYFSESDNPQKLCSEARSHLQLIAAALPDSIAARTAEAFRSNGRAKLSTELVDIEVLSAADICRQELPRAELIAPEEETLPDFDPEALKKALDFRYPFRTLSRIPKKLSASKIKPIINDDDEDTLLMRDSSKLFDKVTTSGAFAGTAAHQFMQFCDYSLAEKDCESEASRLLDEGFISEEQFDALDIGSLQRFFSSPLYERIKKSPRVCREMRFNVFLPARELLNNGSDGDVLLQGVIDCFFENPDGTYSILDFKTDRVRGEKVLVERHAEQLRVYRLAVEKMTSRRVSDTLLYSFSLSRQVDVG